MLNGEQRRAIGALGKLWRCHGESLPPLVREHLVGALTVAKTHLMSSTHTSLRLEDLPPAPKEVSLSAESAFVCDVGCGERVSGQTCGGVLEVSLPVPSHFTGLGSKERDLAGLRALFKHRFGPFSHKKSFGHIVPHHARV